MGKHPGYWKKSQQNMDLQPLASRDVERHNLRHSRHMRFVQYWKKWWEEVTCFIIISDNVIV